MNEDPRGLSMLPLPELRRVRELVAGQRLTAPLTSAALRAASLGRFADALLAALGGLDANALCAALDVAIAERVYRPPPHLRLVWTGPEGQGATARTTEALVHDLFDGAQQQVLIAGFRFDHGAEIFAPLHRVMVERGVQTTIFIDINIEKEPKTVAGAQDYTRRAIEIFFRRNWPFGDPKPTIYFDPRTALPGPPWISLHAKCVLVDARSTLVSSANFTLRAHERNLELGVLIEDAEFASRVAEQWWALVREQKVSRW